MYFVNILVASVHNIPFCSDVRKIPNAHVEKFKGDGKVLL